MSKYPAANFSEKEDKRYSLFLEKFNEQPSIYYILYEMMFDLNIIFDIISKASKKHYMYWFDDEQKSLSVQLEKCFDDVYLEFDAFILHIQIDTNDAFKYTKTEVKHKKYAECTLHFSYKADHEKINEMYDVLELLNAGSKKIKRLKEKTPSYIYLVQTSMSGGFRLKPYEIKNPEVNIKSSYGEQFESIDQYIFETITDRDKGLWIFHGIPGSGKTVYLRNLIKRINEKYPNRHIIYMPAEMVKSIEDPNFLPFIGEHQNAVLILEDADIALQSRDTHGRIVNTVLNLTDGMLADCLKIKVIATFNCELSKIDTALLRKGRLVVRHEFGYLSYDQAIELANLLKVDTNLFDKNKKEWTLAEIYGINEDFHWEKAKKGIGFKS